MSDMRFIAFNAPRRVREIIFKEAEQMVLSGKSHFPNVSRAIRRLIRRADRLAKQQRQKSVKE